MDWLVLKWVRAAVLFDLCSFYHWLCKERNMNFVTVDAMLKAQLAWQAVFGQRRSWSTAWI
jgi:hypothetical protein